MLARMDEIQTSKTHCLFYFPLCVCLSHAVCVRRVWFHKKWKSFLYSLVKKLKIWTTKKIVWLEKYMCFLTYLSLIVIQFVDSNIFNLVANLYTDFEIFSICLQFRFALLYILICLWFHFIWVSVFSSFVSTQTSNT